MHLIRSSIVLLSFLLALAGACSVDKHQLWKCIIRKGDSDGDHKLSEAEIRQLVRENTFWYERLMKSPDSVVKQIQEHCGETPLTYGHFLQQGCFRHCGGLDGKRTIYNRICKER